MTGGTVLKPVLLVPVAVCISLRNDVMPSAFTGGFCGLLIDICTGRLFGYNAVLLTVFCTAVNLLFEFYLRNKFVNFLWVNAVVSALQCALDYEFYYKIWNYENTENILMHVTLKVWAYTVISSVFVYLLLKVIDILFIPKEHFTIEEVIKNNRGGQ